MTRRKRRGRPPLDPAANAPSSRTTIRLPAELHDRACELARVRGYSSVCEAIREALDRALPPLPIESRPGRF